MSDRIIAGRITRAAQLGVLALCGALSACASTGDSAVTFFADPGKYQYHNCKQLATAHTNMLARQKELKGLIDKAEQGAGGVLVGAIAYRSEYVATGEDLKVIDATAREKNCSPPSVQAPPPTRRSDTAIQ